MKYLVDDYPYLNNRLAGTYVVHNSNLVYIEYITEDTGQVHYKDMHDGCINSKHLKDFEIDNVPLGYINPTWQNRCTYLSRYPARQYRQGLRKNYIQSNYPFDMADLTTCVSNKYPSIDTCLEFLVNNEKKSLAWNKKFAFFRTDRNQIHTHYKNKHVGGVNLDNGKVELNDKYLFLAEALEEAVQ